MVDLNFTFSFFFSVTQSSYNNIVIVASGKQDALKLSEIIGLLKIADIPEACKRPTRCRKNVIFNINVGAKGVPFRDTFRDGNGMHKAQGPDSLLVAL